MKKRGSKRTDGDAELMAQVEYLAGRLNAEPAVIMTLLERGGLALVFETIFSR